MEQKLEVMLADALGAAKRVMQADLDKGEMFNPALIICIGSERAVMELGKLGNIKEFVNALMEMTIRKPDVDLVVMCSEAWTVMAHAESEKDAIAQAMKYKSIENHPDRTEALVCMVMSKEEALLVRFPIDRKLKTIGEIDRHDGPEKLISFDEGLRARKELAKVLH